ncbi:YhcN/YlaJ family sporulation lipoprotein [Paenibacillus ginsengarvi]|uniref:YhcN/YlaJ family sporulation lipoprotein n=1 Tax=Paenibacillus ginsengarvi TaxID=400777 RepID=UPI001315166E|nr:YhcN/YlaJ family sporulation lipoprotein [Paenibacillus ginsengarvi]
MVKHTIRFALLASIVAVSASGCATARHDTSGTNGGIGAKSYRSYGDRVDMRLGLDGYRGADPNMIRDRDSLRRGLNRDNGVTGYDQDGVNRWSDYKNMSGATDGRTADGSTAQTPATPTAPQQPRVEAAQSISDQLTGIDPIKTANVLLMGNNAYVAVSTKDGRDIDQSSDVKSKVTQQVQAARPDIKHVYVSANPDFVSRMNGYTRDLNAGKPVSGFIDEFGAMVQRLFPTKQTP